MCIYLLKFDAFSDINNFFDNLKILFSDNDDFRNADLSVIDNFFSILSPPSSTVCRALFNERVSILQQSEVDRRAPVDRRKV